jgi:hypothetical protein
VGYKVSAIPFAGGYPIPSTTTPNALVDILTNAQESLCPYQCFTPVGLSIDGNGRIYMSSDTTGEIWVMLNNTASGYNIALKAGASSTRVWNISTLSVLVLGVVFFMSM